MYKVTLTTLALMGLASAQSTTELFLVGFDQQSILGSVIASVCFPHGWPDMNIESNSRS
jgi:hypothetical protein